jgi:hypothetical protein
MKRLRHLLGWLLVRPRRWLFANMVFNCYLRLWPRHDSYLGWSLPNLHWWLLYKTVFRFCSWLQWGARDKLCVWKDGRLSHEPWYARALRRIGKTTAGYAVSGGECYHCASEAGCQVELSSDETGTTFILERQWTTASECGTDYRFSGTTICPKCGHRQYFEDGSL